MSKRGAEFFAKWITDNVMRGSVGADIISVAELTTRLFEHERAKDVKQRALDCVRRL